MLVHLQQSSGHRLLLSSEKRTGTTSYTFTPAFVAAHLYFLQASSNHIFLVNSNLLEYNEALEILASKRDDSRRIDFRIS